MELELQTQMSVGSDSRVAFEIQYNRLYTIGHVLKNCGSKELASWKVPSELTQLVSNWKHIQTLIK